MSKSSRRFSSHLAAAVALAGLAGTAPPTRAELPPDAYRERQNAAPEVLVIKVRSVATTEIKRADHTLIANSVEASVENVERTATGLKPGATIKILNTQRHNKRPMPGPSDVPTLKEGEVRPAYLAWAKEAEAYSPAAGGFSFSKVEG